MTDIETIREICLDMPEAEETMPFEDSDIIVFKVRGKWFAMFILDFEHSHYIFLKCDHDYAIDLRDEHIGTVEPAWHMNKRYWNMVDFRAPEVNNEFMRHLIAHSYNEVLKKMPRKQREGLQMLKEGIVRFGN